MNGYENAYHYECRVCGKMFVTGDADDHYCDVCKEKKNLDDGYGTVGGGPAPLD